MEILWLSKLIYLVERQSLVRSGRRFTSDRMYSMKHGPVTSTALKLMRHRGDFREGSYWDRYISPPKNGRTVHLKNAAKKPPRNWLSDFELDLAKEVSDMYKRYSRRILYKLVHALPEYTETTARVPIDPAEILRAEGLSEETIEEILAAEREKLRIDF